MAALASCLKVERSVLNAEDSLKTSVRSASICFRTVITTEYIVIARVHRRRQGHGEADSVKDAILLLDRFPAVETILFK